MSGTKNLKKVALDSNIFIYNLEQNSDYIKYTDDIFSRLISKKLRGITSIISLTEILSFPATENVEGKIIESFLDTPNLKVFDVNLFIATEAARIRREYGFRLPDSIQLATAKLNKAQAFISNDERLKKFKEIIVIRLKDI